MSGSDPPAEYDEGQGAPPTPPKRSPPRPAAPPPATYSRPPEQPPARPPPPPPPSAASPAPSPPAGPAPPPPPSYGPGYGYPYYYPGYFPYGYGQPYPSPPLEPRKLRTSLALDAGVFTLLLLGASFAWAALVAAVAAAALVPSVGGSAALGATEASWLDGVMAVRVVVWLVFALTGLVGLGAYVRFHEGRSEFGPAHERAYRDLQAGLAVFLALVGGAGLLSFILSNPGQPQFPAPATSLVALKSSITLSAVLWGVACAAGGFFLSTSLVRLLRPLTEEATQRRLAVVPIFFLFIPLLHAGFSAAFLNMVDPANATWDAAKLHAAGEVGGLAGALAALPLVILIRAFREAHERIVTGKVKPAEPAGKP